MNESAATTGAQVLAVTISQYTLAFVGLPYIACLWGFIGAVAGMVLTPPEGKTMAFTSLLLSGLAGAGGGYAAATWLGGSNPAIIACCLVLGAGAKRVIAAALDAGLSQIAKWGQK